MFAWWKMLVATPLIISYFDWIVRYVVCKIQKHLADWLWFNVTFSDISAIKWRNCNCCQISKFRPAVSHLTPLASRCLLRAKSIPQAVRVCRESNPEVQLATSTSPRRADILRTKSYPSFNSLLPSHQFIKNRLKICAPSIRQWSWKIRIYSICGHKIFNKYNVNISTFGDQSIL